MYSCEQPALNCGGGKQRGACVRNRTLGTHNSPSGLGPAKGFRLAVTEPRRLGLSVSASDSDCRRVSPRDCVPGFTVGTVHWSAGPVWKPSACCAHARIQPATEAFKSTSQARERALQQSGVIEHSLWGSVAVGWEGGAPGLQHTVQNFE